MKKFSFARRAVLLTALFTGLAATSALAQEERVSFPSNKSFEQTVDAFKMAVSKGGMMVMSTVDQGNMLKMTGLEMKGTLFLVGNKMSASRCSSTTPRRVFIFPCACTSIRARTARRT